jgi:hypothetical protein
VSFTKNGHAYDLEAEDQGHDLVIDKEPTNHRIQVCPKNSTNFPMASAYASNSDVEFRTGMHNVNSVNAKKVRDGCLKKSLRLLSSSVICSAKNVTS